MKLVMCKQKYFNIYDYEMYEAAANVWATRGTKGSLPHEPHPRLHTILETFFNIIFNVANFNNISSFYNVLSTA